VVPHRTPPLPQHFAYIIGLNPLTILTEHTPIQLLLDGRIKDGTISQNRIAHWTLMLQGRDITIKRTKTPTLLADNLNYWGEPHECQVWTAKEPIGPIVPKQNGGGGKTTHYRHQVEHEGEQVEQGKKHTLKFFVDGSSSVQDGVRKTGCGAYAEDSEGKVLHELALRLPSAMSAQAAELAAVAYVVSFHQDFPTPADIHSDSMYVCNSLTEFLPLWEARGFVSADGKPLPSAPLLKYIMAQAKGRECGVIKVKAHHRSSPAGNIRADELAKQGAQDGIPWQPPTHQQTEQTGVSIGPAIRQKGRPKPPVTASNHKGFGIPRPAKPGTNLKWQKLSGIVCLEKGTK